MMTLGACDGNDAEPACAPGRQEACACPGGAPEGVQVCHGDGSGFGICEGCKDIEPATCTTAADCPGDDSACGTRTCESGVCGVDAAPWGTRAFGDDYGDCLRLACDGWGGTLLMIDDEDLPFPQECSEFYCEDGELTTFVNTGTVCSNGVCNSSGECVPSN